MPLLIVALTSLFAVASAAPVAAPTSAPAQSAKPSPAGATHQQSPGEDSDPPLTPQQKADFAANMRYRHGVEQSLRNSASPRDWALSTQMLEFDDPGSLGGPNPARAALLRKAAEAAPKDRLVQLIWANAQPENSGCDAQHPCANRPEALAMLEPDNGVGWIPVINTASKANNAAGINHALARMAIATRYDEMFGEAMNAWVGVYRRYPPSIELVRQMPTSAPVDLELVEQVYAMSEVVTMVMPAYQSLVNACKREKQPDAGVSRFENCGNAGRLMLNQSTNMIGRMMGRALLRVSGTANASDIEAARVLAWQFEQYGQPLAKTSIEPAASRAYFADLEESGSEVVAIQMQLRRAGVSLTPPANWQPTRDGKPISPLGEAPASAK